MLIECVMTSYIQYSPNTIYTIICDMNDENWTARKTDNTTLSTKTLS